MNIVWGIHHDQTNCRPRNLSIVLRPSPELCVWLKWEFIISTKNNSCDATFGQNKKKKKEILLHIIHIYIFGVLS